MATVCVYGTWHQASVLGPCLASLGHLVRGVGADSREVDALAGGHPPVFEPGLDELLTAQMRSGRLSYGHDLAAALNGATIAIIAIDTPVLEDDSPDLSPVLAAASAIGAEAPVGLTLVISSQVPVGTCHRVQDDLRREHPAKRIEVAYVPEFLRLGSAVELFMHPDRIVIGADSSTTIGRVADLYTGIQSPIYRTNLRTAEMIKHASNAFLALSVSFINEIAGICEETGADALAVAGGMKLDRRIGPAAFLSPGLGFAGGTLGRDVRALQALARHHGRATELLDATMRVNTAQGRLVLDRLAAALGDVAGRRIALLGLTYKPGTSTLRRSASVQLAHELQRMGALVSAFDPMVRADSPTDELREIALGRDVLAAVDGTDAVVLMTEWPEFADIDWTRVAASMVGTLVIDARNALQMERVVGAGLRYWGIGQAGGSDRFDADGHNAC